jgi:kynureninase
MAPEFIPSEGAYGFRVSNPPVLLIAGARASLDLFDEVCDTVLLARGRSTCMRAYVLRIRSSID